MTHHPVEQVLHFDETNDVRLEFVADDLATDSSSHVDKLEVNLVEDGPSFQAWKLSNFTGIIIARRIEKTDAASSPLQEGEVLSVSPVGSPLSLQESSTKDGSSMDEEDLLHPITTPTAASIDATLSPVREDASAESSETSSLKHSEEIDMPLFSAPNETLPSVMENSRAEALDFSGSEDGFHDRRPAVVDDSATHVHGNEATSSEQVPELEGLPTEELATPLLRDETSREEVGTESEPSIPVTPATKIGSGDESSSKKLTVDTSQKEDRPESVSSHSEKQNGDASSLKVDDDNRFAFYIPETTIFEADRPQSESIPNEIQQKSGPISEYGDNEDAEQEDGEQDDGSIATTSSGLSFGSSKNSGNATKFQSEKLLQLVKKAKNDARKRRHSEHAGPSQTTATTEKPTRKSFRSPLNETASSRLSRLSNFDLSSLTALSNHTSNRSHDGSGKHGRNVVNRALNKTAKGAGMIAKGAAKATGLSHLKSAVNFRGHAGGDTKEESEEESDKGSSFPSKSRWSFVVNMHNVKMKVPQKVRMRRQERRRMTSDGSLQVYKAPTRLHELCADPDVVLDDLMAELARSPHACKVTDAKGRLPIHWLGKFHQLLLLPMCDNKTDLTK